jgi:hypothetical protein
VAFGTIVTQSIVGNHVPLSNSVMMDHNYLDQFRNLRDDFKQFQHESPTEDPMRTLEEIWLSPSAIDLGSTNELEPRTQPSSSSNQRVNPILTPSSNSVGGAEARLSLSEEETNSENVSATGGSAEGVNHILGESHAGLDVSHHPRPRKGHKKSRQGCYNCKRRKIKVYMLFLSTWHVRTD